MDEHEETNEIESVEEVVYPDDSELKTETDFDPVIEEEVIVTELPLEDDLPPVTVVEKKVRTKGSRRVWLLVAVISLLIIGLAVFFGYRDGVNRRIVNERNMLMDQISVQLDWVYKDIDAERYENAKTRLEYIIDKYPGFPGASDLLVEVMMKMEAPTPVPPTPVVVMETETPEVVVTPDSRVSEETFVKIQQHITNEEWDQAIENIHALKETDYAYKTVEVDGLYFIALRNRGIQRIWAGEIEQGMYDLSVAEQLGAIDSVAAGAVSWGSLYMTGASFWDVNWAGAVDIFSQLYAQMPYFSDSSGMTSAERYRIALYRLGDQFAANGDYCTASSYYNQSLQVGVNLDIQVTATWLAETCANPPSEETPEAPADPNATPVPPEESPEVPTEPPAEP